jgi:hypothetical protein
MKSVVLRVVGWLFAVIAVVNCFAALAPYLGLSVPGAVQPGPRSVSLSNALMGAGMLGGTAIAFIRAGARAKASPRR